MSKTYKKKDREKFEREMMRWFEDRAFETKPKNYDSTPAEYLYLHTNFGIYEVRHIEASDEGNMLNVMGAFRETKNDGFQHIRDAGIDCNPYTGKWNFHLMDHTVDDIIDHITSWFERIGVNHVNTKKTSAA